MPPSLMIDRRLFLTGASAALALPAYGQSSIPRVDYPTKRINILVPKATGDVIDRFLRVFLNDLPTDFSLGFLLTDQPANGGAIAARTIAKASPDGYTLLIGTPETQAIAPEQLRHPDYDPTTDFATVCGLCDVPLVLAARRSLPAQSLRDLITLMNAQPVRYRYGSTGPGSLSFMATQIVLLRARAEAIHVPCASETQLAQALLAEQIDFAILPLSPVWPAFRAGQVKLFAQMGEERYRLLSALPTIRQAGLVDAEVMDWFACYAPAKTPNAVLDSLANAITATLQKPAVLQLLDRDALIADPRTPAQLDTLATQQRALFAEVIRLKSLKSG